MTMAVGGGVTGKCRGLMCHVLLEVTATQNMQRHALRATRAIGFCSLRDTSQEKLVFPKMRGFRKKQKREVETWIVLRRAREPGRAGKRRQTNRPKQGTRRIPGEQEDLSV